MSDMLHIIDSHAHLDYPQFEAQLDDVIGRAASLGVREMITIGVKLSTAERPRKLAEKYDNIWFSAGIHPHEAGNEADASNYEAIRDAVDHPRCVAVGEAGLDYFYDHAPRQAQEDSFRTQIAVARDTGLPIIVHARDADDDMIDILTDEMHKGAFTGVLHCFSSGAALAQAALEIGFYISFSGIITFNKSETLREIAKSVPLSRILVETDSPYLAPTPYRGKTNEPGYTRYVCEKVAEIKQVELSEMARQTRQNTYELFTKMNSH